MDTLADTLWQEFAVETDEHLQAAESILAAADRQSVDPPDIAQLFRSFHSLKGLARALGLAGMEAVAHEAESLLYLVREGRTALTGDLADLLLQAIDALKRSRAAATSGEGDAPPDQQLLARLRDAFVESSGTPAAETPGDAPPAGPATNADEALLQADDEMLGIFVEMVEARGPELCGAIMPDPTARETALEAAETLAHAAEVINLPALAESFARLAEVVRPSLAQRQPDEASRRELLGCLGDLRLRIALLEEVTGKDAGSAGFSAALALVVGDEPRRIAQALISLNRQLRDNLDHGERLAAEADAASMVPSVRTLQAMLAAVSHPQAADLALLLEDIFARVAAGEFEPPDSLLEAAEAVFWSVAESTADLLQDKAADLAARLRGPLGSGAHEIAAGAANLVAGVAIPAELLTVLSDAKLAEFERGIRQEGLAAYEVVADLEADRAVAEELVRWLSEETRVVTNRAALNGSDNRLMVLLLSPLEPEALAGALTARDPASRCLKSARRLTGTPEGETIWQASPPAEPVPEAPEPAAPAAEPIRQAAEPVAEAPAAPQFGAPANLIRVRGEAVDDFLDNIGELRVAAGRLGHLLRGAGSRAAPARTRSLVERLPPGLQDDFRALIRDFRERDRQLLEVHERVAGMLSRLHQAALELRVVPIDVVFNRLPRLVRDLAQQLGKSVELSLEGRDVRIDKSMIEALADPLMHMVRNAIDHGIERPDERRAAGKPERARLTLRAAQRGSEIHIEIADDGSGLDTEAIRAKAIARGLVSAEAASALSADDVHRFIFEAGLSTAAMVTETSGRGVGMDIVLAVVRRLDGDIAVRSDPGRGTVFSLLLPASAALQTALIVRVGEQSLAIPERHVVAVAEIEAASAKMIGGQRSMLHRETVLPLYGLGDLLGMAPASSPNGRQHEPIVITGNGRHMIGLEVDAIERRQELFLKELDPRLASFPGIGGASVLGDGRVVLVLDAEELLQLAARGLDPVEATAASLP